MLEGHRDAFVGVVLVAALVTGFGIAWLSVRSTLGGRAAWSTIVARHDQAVISREAHLLREGGAFYDPGRHWLTATTGAPAPPGGADRSTTPATPSSPTWSGGDHPVPETLGRLRPPGRIERVAFLRSDVELAGHDLPSWPAERPADSRSSGPLPGPMKTG